MIDNKKILAIIPARGGSKGLPNKNIKMLCGKPLIAWSIDSALKSKYIDEVVVSTDSVEIAGIAKKFGANVPFIRPSRLAEDNSPTFLAIEHALHFMSAGCEVDYEYVVLLEPTSPIREVHDLDSAIEILNNSKEGRSIVSVSKTESQNPAFLVNLEANFIRGFNKSEIATIRRQEIGDVFFFDGSFYISNIEFYLAKKNFYHDKTLAYVVEKWKSFEIDDEYDFVIVEALMRYMNGL